MTLVVILALFSFFMAGYYLHRMQYLEQIQTFEKAVELIKEDEEYIKEEKHFLNEKSKSLSDTAEALQVNFNNRWKEVETRINENDVLKNQIFQMKKNCTCGVK